jgi:predicted small metal-binding protein
VHCRDLHDAQGCNWTIDASDAEAVREAIQHVTLFHHAEDTPTLRERVRERVDEVRPTTREPLDRPIDYEDHRLE